MVGPYRFRVWTKGGQIADYGSRFWVVTAGWTQGGGRGHSLQPRQNASKQWVLDRVLDRSGNFMEIDYADRPAENVAGGSWDPAYGLNLLHLPGNCAYGPGAAPAAVPTPIGALPNVEIWPTAIRYYSKGSVASECGSSPNNQVRFVYADVPSQVAIANRDRYYDSGQGQASLTKRLIGIRTSVDGVGTAEGALVSSWTLDYDDSQQTGRSLLKSIRQCGSDGACLPDTTFAWAANDPVSGWGATGTKFNFVNLTGLPFGIHRNGHTNNGVYVVDWNGDGKSDLVGWKHDYNSTPGLYDHQLIVCLSMSTPYAGSGFNCNPNPIFAFTDSYPTVDNDPTYRVDFMDVNGDGRADLAVVAVLPSNQPSNWTVRLSDGNYGYVNAPGSWTTAAQNLENQSFRGDIDGDGKIDIITYDRMNSNGRIWIQTCLTTDSGFACSYQDLRAGLTACPANDPSCEAFDGNSVTQILVADVNGDGKADLVMRRSANEGEDKWKTCFSDFGLGRTNSYICHDRFVQGSKAPVNNTVLFDFNGDGIADLASPLGVTTGQDDGRWLVCLSTGDGAFEFTALDIHWDPNAHDPDPTITATGAWVNGAGVPINYYTISRCRIWNGSRGLANSANNKTVFGDFNGDGRTDLAAWDKNNHTWRICLSTGSNFLTDSTLQCPVWQGPSIPINPPGDDPDLNQWVVSGDFNGDGKTDLLVMYPDGSGAVTGNGQLALAAGPVGGDVLVKVTTGLGAMTLMTYAPLTDTNVYTKAASNGTLPNAQQHELDIQSPMYVVNATAESNGVGGIFTKTYSYENLRGRTDGRGLYGFLKKRVIDSNGIDTQTEYFRDTALNYAANWPVYGRPSIVRKYVPGGQLVGQIMNAWGVLDSTSCGGVCGGIPRIKTANLNSAVEASWELDGSALPTTTTSTPFASIDAFGNPGQVTVSTSDGYSKQTNNSYLNDTGNWILGRLTGATATLKKGATQVTRISAFKYHGLNAASCVGAVIGQLCEETIESFGTDWQSTDYEYDPFGNRVAATLTFREPDGTQKSRTSRTQYDAQGRFATVVTNAAFHSESRVFNPRWGVVTQHVGPNGVTTSSLFDGFGRKYGERVFDAAGARIAETFTPVESAGLTGSERYRVRNVASGSGESQTYFDSLQREVRVASKAFNANTYAQATTTYDNIGRKYQVVKPAGAGTVTTTFTYDPLSRLKTERMSDASDTAKWLLSTYTYGTVASITIDGVAVTGVQTTRITQTGSDIVARDSTRYVNSQGKTVRTLDGEGGTTSFVYDAYGNLSKAIGPTGIAELMDYDVRGRKIRGENPDSGIWRYDYNGAGELVKQTDAIGQVTLMFYDSLGRMIERREHPVSGTPFVTVFTFDAYADPPASGPCQNGIGKLCEVRTATVARTSSAPGSILPNPETQKLAKFDVAGRINNSETRIDGKSFVTFTTFDPNGRVDKIVYPSGYTVAHRYTAWSGQLDQIAEVGGFGTVHWQATSRFSDGQIQSMQVGALTTSKTYDLFGRVASINTGSIQTASYTFDVLSNLTSRNGPESSGTAQAFAYDRVSRLTNYAGTPSTYFADGNLQNGIGGTYSYTPGSHRLTGGAGATYTNYDANGNVHTISGGRTGVTRTLSYTAFNLPYSITGSGSISYIYDGAHARIKEVSSGGPSSGTTYYLGSYEEHTRASDAVVEKRHYLNTPEGAVGIYTSRVGAGASNDTRYWHKDHLGSIAVITDAAGAIKQKFSFDAWGNRALQGFLATGEPYAEERGYTGHEHLVEVGLVHMNGRIYDPSVGRFLQADPLIQDPFNGQNYNRYAYVLNNPLSFTDPSGFSFWTKWRKPIIAIAATVATAGMLSSLMIEYAVVNGMTVFTEVGELGTVVLSGTGQAVIAGAGGFAAGGIQGGNVESAVQGAIFAWANFGIGELTGHTPTFGTKEFASNVGLHAALGCGQQAAAGGSCRGGAMAGGFSAFAGPLIQGPMPVQLVERVLIGGAASKLGGGKFENGMMTAAFDYLFNDLGSVMREELRRSRSGIRGFHDYSNWTPCESCAGIEDQAALKAALVAELKTTPAWSGRWECGDATCSFAGPGRVWHVDGSTDVSNITKIDHLLHPGVVTRTVESRDGVLGISTYAVGWGFLPRVNELLAGTFWSWRDRVVIERALERR